MDYKLFAEQMNCFYMIGRYLPCHQFLVSTEAHVLQTASESSEFSVEKEITFILRD